MKTELKYKTQCQVAKETVCVLPVIIKGNIAHALFQEEKLIQCLQAPRSLLSVLTPGRAIPCVSLEQVFLALPIPPACLKLPLTSPAKEKLSWLPGLAWPDVLKIITT